MQLRGKGSWKVADTLQVLLDVLGGSVSPHEAISAFCPMLPHLKYYRLNPGEAVEGSIPLRLRQL